VLLVIIVADCHMRQGPTAPKLSAILHMHISHVVSKTLLYNRTARNQVNEKGASSTHRLSLNKTEEVLDEDCLRFAHGTPSGKEMSRRWLIRAAFENSSGG